MSVVARFPLKSGLRFVSTACVLAIIVLSLLPGSERPHTGLPGQFEHIIAYAGTGFFLALRFQTLLAQAFVWTVMAAMSGVLEMVQVNIPGRDPKFIDAFASTSGLTLGLLFGVYGGKYLTSFLSKIAAERHRAEA